MYICQRQPCQNQIKGKSNFIKNQKRLLGRKRGGTRVFSTSVLLCPKMFNYTHFTKIYIEIYTHFEYN